MTPAPEPRVRRAGASRSSASARVRLSLCALVGALLASACSYPLLGNGERVAYDFGPATLARRGEQSVAKQLLVYDVVAPAWMNSASIHYRLAFRDASRPQAYAGSRWVMAPAELLGARLRQRLADAGAGVIVPGDGLRAPAALRVELDEFSQVFDAQERSRAVVRLRASLVGARALIAQKSFSAQQAAASHNAEGGVHALAAASDEVIEQLLDWVAASLKDAKQ